MNSDWRYFVVALLLVAVFIVLMDDADWRRTKTVSAPQVSASSERPAVPNEPAVSAPHVDVTINEDWRRLPSNALIDAPRFSLNGNLYRRYENRPDGHYFLIANAVLPYDHDAWRSVDCIALSHPLPKRRCEEDKAALESHWRARNDEYFRDTVAMHMTFLYAVQKEHHPSGDLNVQICGHSSRPTVDVGTAEHNANLSLRRAEAVRDEIFAALDRDNKVAVKHWLAGRIGVVAMGSADPVRDEANGAVMRLESQRAEIVVRTTSGALAQKIIAGNRATAH